jgi:hypothetical protein
MVYFLSYRCASKEENPMRGSRAVGIAGTVFLLPFLLCFSTDSACADTHGRVSFTVGFGGYFGAPAYLGYGGFYYPAAYPPDFYVPPMPRPYYAMVDTDIHPEEASVYLDGRPIGIADDFDGYPGYLALKPGRHTLVFLREGYHSLSFALDLHAGEMVNLDRKLQRLSPGEAEEPPPTMPPNESVRERPTPPPNAQDGKTTHPRRFGTLRLEVTPAEARVILDGDFFGTASEISRLHAGIPLSTGTHRVRVSLSGYQSAAVETEISDSEERNLRISLKKL